MSALLTSQRRDWSPYEDHIIKTNMDDMPHAEIAKLLLSRICGTAILAVRYFLHGQDARATINLRKQP